MRIRYIMSEFSTYLNQVLGETGEIHNIGGDNVVLAKDEFTGLAEASGEEHPDLTLAEADINTPSSKDKPIKPTKTFDDYAFQVYTGALTVVGLFIFYRMIQKSR